MICFKHKLNSFFRIADVCNAHKELIFFLNIILFIRVYGESNVEKRIIFH